MSENTQINVSTTTEIVNVDVTETLQPVSLECFFANGSAQDTVVNISENVLNIDLNVTETQAQNVDIEFFYPAGPAGPQGPQGPPGSGGGGSSLWGTISGTLSAQTDLWRYLSAVGTSNFDIATLNNYLSTTPVLLSSLNVNGQILSAGVNLLDIFLTSETDSQTLSYITSSYLLSISNGNTVNLSSINSTFAANSGKYESTFTNVQTNSANWNYGYNTATAYSAASSSFVTNTNFNNYQTNVANTTATLLPTSIYQQTSGSFAPYSYVDSNFLALSGGVVQGPVRINNNLTVFGNLTASGTTTFANTIFSVTSALSVVHIGSGPAVWIGNNGDGDIASFYDIDQNIEILHVGGNNGTFPNVGVKTSTPNKDLTVQGELSASNVIYDGVGNSNQWNSAFGTSTAYQSASSSFATNTNLNAVSSLLTPLTLTNTLTSRLLLASIYQEASGNWQQAYTNLVTNSAAYLTSVDLTFLQQPSANWNTAYRHVSSQSLNTTDNVQFNQVFAQTIPVGNDGFTIKDNGLYYGQDLVFDATDTSFWYGGNLQFTAFGEWQVPFSFIGVNAAANISQTRTNLGLGSADNVQFNQVNANVYLSGGTNLLNILSSSGGGGGGINLATVVNYLSTNSVLISALTVTGNLSAARLFGDGSGLTNINFVLSSNNTTLSTVTLNPIAVLSGTNFITSRVLQDKLGEVISVKDFGARGNGVANDWLPIQRALSAAAGIARVYIPQGLYFISQELRIPSNSYIYGAGIGTTIIKLSSTANASQCVMTNSQNTRSVITNQGNENITIKDLELDGNVSRFPGSYSPIGDTSGTGLCLANVHNAFIERVAVHDTCRHCIDICAPETSITFNPLDYVANPSYNVHLKDVIAYGAGDDNITTHFSHNITIENAYVPYTGGTEVPTNSNGIEIDDGSYDITIIGGYIKNCRRGLEVKGHSWAPAAKRVKVYGLTVENCVRNFGIRHLGFDFTDSKTAFDVALYDCTSIAPISSTFTTDTPRSLQISNYDGVFVKDFKVVGEHNASRAVTIQERARNIKIDGMTFTQISGAITGITDALLYVDNTTQRNVTLQNLVFRDCVGLPIYITGNIPGIVVDGVDAFTTVSPGASSVVDFTWAPTTVPYTVRNVSVSGYNYVHTLGGSHNFDYTLPSNVGLVENIVPSSPASTNTQYTVAKFGWREGTGQSLNAGVGVRVDFTSNIFSGVSAGLDVPVAYIGTRKVNGTDSDVTSNLTFGTLSANNASLQDRMSITPTGLVGINTTTPNERLTVVGNISATGNISTQGQILSAGINIATLFGGGTVDTQLRALTGNWQSTYTTVQSNSSSWQEAYNVATAYQSVSSSFATNSTVNSVSSLLTPLTLTNSLTSQLVTNTNFTNYQTSVAASTATLLPTTIYQNASGNWQSTFTTVQTNSASWGTGGGGGSTIDTGVRALTGNWQSTYTTVQSNSASWVNSKTIAQFTAIDNQPLSADFATLDTRISIAVLDFDDTTTESACFVGVIPEGTNLSSGLQVRLHWAASTATTGNVDWGVQFMNLNTPLSADSFDTAAFGITTTSNTLGLPSTTTITCTALNGMIAGSFYRMRVFRDSADTVNDTLSGDAELIAAEVRSVA